MSIEDLIKSAVAESFAEILPQIIAPLEKVPDVMTLKQLAKYWQVNERSISRWTLSQNNPLPVHYVGSDPRFYRAEIDEWSRNEATLQLAKARKAA